MKDIKVWVYGRQQPILFSNVEDYYETRKALTVIQEDMYTAVTTKIFKQAILMYEVTDTL